MEKFVLLWGAGIKFATWLFAMHRMLRQKQALKASIHNSQFTIHFLFKKYCVAIKDIEDEVFGMQVIVFFMQCFLP